MAAKINKGFFTKVRVAREKLQERAEEILTQYLEVVKQAQEAGEYEVAAKSLQWLIEHMPEEDGQRMVDTHVDKAKQEQIQQGPRVQIGIQLGGINQPKALPTPTTPLPEITVEPINE